MESLLQSAKARCAVVDIKIRLWIRTIDGYNGTNALKSRWVISYIYI